MNNKTTTPSPISYGMAYMRAKETGVLCYEPDTTPMLKKASEVGEPPILDPEVKANLFGEATIPAQPTNPVPMPAPEVRAELLEDTTVPEQPTTQAALWDLFEKHLKSHRRFKRVMYCNGRWLHKNSRPPEEGAAQARMQRVLDVFRREARPMTDREIATALDYTDMNAVRPSITLAIKRGFLEEVDDVKDELTNYEVRRCQPTTQGFVT